MSHVEGGEKPASQLVPPHIHPDWTKPVSVSVAFFALLLSSYSFYFLNVRQVPERHKLMGQVSYMEIVDKGQRLRGIVIVPNLGNQPEVLRNVRLVFCGDPDCSEGGVVWDEKDYLGPIVVKAGDTFVQSLGTSFLEVKLQLKMLKTADEGRAFVNGAFETVDVAGNYASALY